jgi:hypothetical protein
LAAEDGSDDDAPTGFRAGGIATRGRRARTVDECAQPCAGARRDEVPDAAFHGSTLSGDASVEVDLGYGTDRFTAADGLGFWSRPVAANSVTVRFVPGTGGRQLTLSEYGRGERLAAGSAT